jgi:hypothetical protein
MHAAFQLGSLRLGWRIQILLVSRQANQEACPIGWMEGRARERNEWLAEKKGGN